jgi:hypothetical protein
MAESDAMHPRRIAGHVPGVGLGQEPVVNPRLWSVPSSKVGGVIFAPVSVRRWFRAAIVVI